MIPLEKTKFVKMDVETHTKAKTDASALKMTLKDYVKMLIMGQKR